MKPLEYKTWHHPTTSSTLCSTPHLNNKQNKNTHQIISRQDYHLTQCCASEEKQTNKQKKPQHKSHPIWNLHKPQDKASVQFTSVAQSYLTLCHPMNRSTPGLSVHHQLPEFTQTHFHRVSDAIQPSHPLLSPSPPAPSPSQHQSLFQWVNSSHEVAKVLEFQF